jgi:hypothetical protein
MGSIKNAGSLKPGAIFVVDGKRYKAQEVNQRPSCAWHSRNKVHVRTNDGGNIMCFDRCAYVEIV